MANRRQSIKKIRVDLRRRERNVRVLSELKTFARRFREQLSAKKKNEAVEAFRSLTSKLDKAVKKKVLHANQASRLKSRLQKKLSSLVPVKTSK